MNDPRVLTVSELTRQVKELVEANWPTAWVVGEISNCTRAGSGHVYFTLKDDSAQLRAVMWRSRASRVKFDLHDGLEVVASGAIEVYEARGTYQLIVEQLIPQGVGALELAFRQLQEKLSAAGLFDPERKRPLPSFPRRIALITSPSSAAVRDMLQVITRRWQTADIVILPVAVQGDGAAEQIAAALRMVHEIPGVDVVIAGRGGGSLEDLWAFNEEVVARAIFDCRVPVISAVGHEIDVTIADLVADRRALTPSEAAELVVPNRVEVIDHLRQQRSRLGSLLRSQAQRARLELEAISSRRVFEHPLERIHDLTARVDETAARLRRAVVRRVETKRRSISEAAARLHGVSPLNVLGRGYSVTYRGPTGTILRDADDVSAGEEIVTWLARGRINSRIESVDATSKRISGAGAASREDIA
jgi:exodeoxyribonuclease VII large subunit